MREAIEKLVRLRLLRVGAATALIIFGLWSFFPYVAYRVAPVAIVNSELVRVTARIEGQLTKSLPRKGDVIDGANQISLIQSTTIDRSQLVSLEQQYEQAKSHAALAESQIEELRQEDQSLAQRSIAYRTSVTGQLNAQIDELMKEISACGQEQEARRSTMARYQEGASRDIVSKVQMEGASADFYKVAQNCNDLRSRQRGLLAQRDASTHGNFTTEIGAPFFEQQRSHLVLTRQELERELLDWRSKMDELQAQIGATRSHVESLENFNTSLPGGYIVWSVLASPGSAVVQGEPILELANCNNPFVVVEFPERDLASIHVGDPADIRLVGDDQWTVGKVRRVRGSAAKNDEGLFAAAIPNPKDSYMNVEVSLPNPGGEFEAGRGCDIGRLAEVRLGRHAYDVVSWLAEPLKSILGGADRKVAKSSTVAVANIRQ